ncbi:phosphate ABC transporter substrate-binding protein [Nodosilinea sp. LEGE 07088]|uniref:phosphate ABC transporter substrate-binding protein n=1 Tax=Nodosilinea sp. LEGE 07088 TaxID=2777968 RepID=UPI00187EE66D|nr:phosphate ABC transporter substrate-binding protein [Nodosilinea sp. LEGE 07088]MBE9137562.1 phosphate ABC transporter substrate-binding protein [Nodosilinea sp. LEGE 07088]
MANDNSSVKRSGPPPIVFILLLLGLLGGAYWFFLRKPKPASVATPPAIEAPQADTTAPASFALQPSVVAGTAVNIDGSTSMVQINAALEAAFEQQYPGTVVNIAAAGSSNGINALLEGAIDVAASSRPLTADEQAKGLVAVPVTSDRMALVVGNDNPYKRGLSKDQAAQIFQGQLDNWATLGGPNATIRVINRPSVSGTHVAFKELVLNGGEFGTTPNITTLARDATTPMLRELGADGIGYATYSQVADQQTVRVLAIDGVTPESSGYPFQRELYYVYRDANSPAVQAFLGYALSSQGQQAIATAGN